MAKLLGLHTVELRPGVEAQVFECFVLREFLPALCALRVPGVEFHLLKADRGARDGKYLFVMEFDRVETRDRYFPGHNQPSPALVALIQPLRELSETWDRLSEREKTDYVQLDGPGGASAFGVALPEQDSAPALAPAASPKAAGFDDQYRRGDWDFLFSLDEVGHYMVIAGYLLHLAPQAAILDVGCGHGRLLELIHLLPYRGYLGLDISAEAIRQAAPKASARDRFEVVDYEDWRPAEVFDAIIFNEAIYYASDPLGMLRRYSRALGPNGVLIVSIHGYQGQERIWESVDGEFVLLARDRVENQMGQVWEVRALRPRTPDGRGALRRLLGRLKALVKTRRLPRLLKVGPSTPIDSPRRSPSQGTLRRPCLAPPVRRER